MNAPTLEEQEHRHVEWIELFYDLAFVATIASFASQAHPENLLSLAQSLVVLTVLWWAWTGFVFYSSRFQPKSGWISVITVVKIIGVCGLGISAQIPDAYARYLFPGSYVLLRSILLLLYGISYRNRPKVRPFLRRYLIGFSLALVPWIALFFLPSGYWVWLAPLGMFIDMATPLLFTPIKYHQLAPPHLEHMTERLGLFYLIVLGEILLSIVNVDIKDHMHWPVLFIAGTSVAIAFMLWWLYSDRHQLKAIRDVSRVTQLFVYLHLPLVVSTFFFSVGVKHALHAESVLLPRQDVLMLVIPLACVLVCITGIFWLRHRRYIPRFFRLSMAMTLLLIGWLGWLENVYLVFMGFVVLLAAILLVEQNACGCASRRDCD